MAENPYEGSNDSSEPAKQTAKTNIWLILFGVGTLGVILVIIFLPLNRSASRADRHFRCITNLKNIGLALYNYHDVHGEFPPAYTVDENGKPLHSWRTLLLPFLEEQALYDSIDLTKAWDDPVNAKALDVVLPVYCCPELGSQTNQTVYLGVVSSDSCLQPEKSKKMTEISDGLMKTIIVMEMPASKAVPWMAPMDAGEEMVMRLKEAEDLPHSYTVGALFADGHLVSLVPTVVTEETLRGVMTASGNEPVEIE